MFSLDKVKYLFLSILLLNGCADGSKDNNIVTRPSYGVKKENWEQAEKKIVAQEYDTWVSLAQDSQIPITALWRFNHKKANNKMRSGDIILIPAKTMYQVKNGETAIGVALKYGLTFSEFVGINNLVEPYEIKINSKVKVIEVNALQKQKKITTKLEEAEKVIIKPNKTKETFIWPVKGEVTSTFGLQTSGAHNDAILISATEPLVIATKSGEVVYTGNEVGSYGNLVIIQHDHNWFSSYAHLDKIIVQKGDAVKIGQVLGYINNSELYFSLRNGTNPVNPIKYLPKKNREKNAG